MAMRLDVMVAVVGAGPVGASLACRLAESGIATAVIDRAPLPPMEHPDFDGRAYAIASGSRPLLDAGGVWPRLPFPACPILGIRVTDGRLGRPASRLRLGFDVREAGSDAPFGWMVEARSLRMALNARMEELPDLSVFAPAEARVERSDSGVRITLMDGTEIAARLVVAAEGRRSPLARAARIPFTRFSYGQEAIVTAIAHERPHENVALEHFLPAGPFAQLPMSATGEEPHVSAIVWTEEARLAPSLFTLDDARFGAEIARRLGGHLGAVRPIGRRFRYPIGAMLAHRYIDVRMALAGDAAHGIHPIAGQGLNLGFRDAIALAALMEEAAASGADPGAPALLRRYQRARRADNLLMLAATDGLERLFSNDIAPLRLARDLGIAAVDRMPRLKRFFIRQATGSAA
ncbi:MAG TPA: UbiH/UbiF/VisC/COQ6 family ubiquinone biosynthesis hydroxylase [Acetobacteraceae bacterium]|nr:UbiH/UbiF/VisC/COQ6 family ubiquinone biosynthesis hydroxylase [Acetobacteraceae bacterium]